MNFIVEKVISDIEYRYDNYKGNIEGDSLIFKVYNSKNEVSEEYQVSIEYLGVTPNNLPDFLIDVHSTYIRILRNNTIDNILNQ